MLTKESESAILYLEFFSTLFLWVLISIDSILRRRSNEISTFRRQSRFKTVRSFCDISFKNVVKDIYHRRAVSEQSLDQTKANARFCFWLLGNKSQQNRHMVVFYRSFLLLCTFKCFSVFLSLNALNIFEKLLYFQGVSLVVESENYSKLSYWKRTENSSWNVEYCNGNVSCLNVCAFLPVIQ